MNWHHIGLVTLLAAPLYIGFALRLLLDWASEPDEEERYWREQYRRWQM